MYETISVDFFVSFAVTSALIAPWKQSYLGWLTQVVTYARNSILSATTMIPSY